MRSTRWYVRWLRSWGRRANASDALGGAWVYTFAMLSTPIARLRLIGLIESLSWFALLFIAVPMKRMPGLFGMERGDETLVQVLGPIHGGLWCLYLLAIYLAAKSPGLPRKAMVLALVCTFLPFPIPLLILDPKLKAHEQDQPLAA